jgi:hypothetical protein
LGTGAKENRSVGEVVQFKRTSPAKKAEGKTLCGRGFHKWRVAPKKQFDVHRGRLVTVHKCERCGATKTTLD